MFDPKNADLAAGPTQFADLLQMAAEQHHCLVGQTAFTHGHPLVLPYATFFLERCMSQQGQAHLPESGDAPVMHIAARTETVEQMHADAQAQRDIHERVRGVTLSPTCYVLLFQFEIGGVAIAYAFDAQDPTINRAFRGWLQQGHIAAVINSPGYGCVVNFPCNALDDWCPFIEHTAANNVVPTHQRQAQFASQVDAGLDKLREFCSSQIVLGTSLGQLIAMANFLANERDMPTAS